jgi:hypothetical protein
VESPDWLRFERLLLDRRPFFLFRLGCRSSASLRRLSLVRADDWSSVG